MKALRTVVEKISREEGRLECGHTFRSELHPVPEPRTALVDCAECGADAPRPAHPEDRCERCGGPNIVWHAPNELWNRYAGDHSILCPVCFARLADAAGGRKIWRLAPAHPEEEPTCPECGGRADWKPCPECAGEGTVECLCEGDGGEYRCSLGCDDEVSEANR
jgi:hypothetical protein